MHLLWVNSLESFNNACASYMMLTINYNITVRLKLNLIFRIMQ